MRRRDNFLFLLYDGIDGFNYMSKMAYKIALLIGVIITGIFLGCSRAEAAPPEYIIRLASLAPAESCWGDFAQKVKSYIEERSRGRAKIIWYMSGVAGDEPVVLKKIQKGELQGAVLTINGMGLVNPELRVLLLPFLIQNYAEEDFILDSMFPEFKQLAEEKGYALLGFTEVGFNRIFTKEPVQSIQDLSRLKMWTWGGEDLVESVLQDVGFTHTVPLPLLDVKNALEKGTVTAYYCPCYAQAGLQWYRNAGYMSDYTFGYSPGAVVIDKKYFQSLPPDIQNTVRQAMDFILKPLRVIVRDEEEKACRILVRRGMKANKSSPEFIAELKRRSNQLYYKYADKEYRRELLQKIIDRLREFRSR